MSVVLFFSLILLMLLVTPAASQQYTPTQSNWATFYSKVGQQSHDPNGVSWISATAWNNARWDGKTIFNPSKMTKAEFTAAICPTIDTIRGIREVFYQTKPFANNKNPTKEEVDNWHRIAINHVRRLVGYTSADRQVQPDVCMFARALWGAQRRNTNMWDRKYPGPVGTAFGPCIGGKNPHCGSTFVPSAADQVPYLPKGHSPCTAVAGAEGIASGPKSDIPWSIKWSRSLCTFLMSEGFFGGHVGPFFHREKFGFDFWDAEPTNPKSNAVFTGKWTGKLMPSLYTNPAAAMDDTATDAQQSPQSNLTVIIIGCVAGFAVLLVVVIVVVVTRRKDIAERV